MKTRVIAMGQAAAGDDGVGLAVLAALRELPEGGRLDLFHVRDEHELLDLLETSDRVVVVDGVLAAPVGEVFDLDPARLSERPRASVTTHGLGCGQALALARVLRPQSLTPDLRVVAIAIDRPRGAVGLSPAAERAVSRAVRRILSIASEPEGGGAGDRAAGD